MRSRRSIVSVILAVSVVGTVAAPATAGTPRRAKAVGTDAAGDWSPSGVPGGGPAGDVLGQDLTKASISMRGRNTVVFDIHLTSLPPAAVATAPTGYSWDFTVNGLSYELIGCTPSLVVGCPEAPVGAMPFQVYECLFTLFGGCVQVGSALAELDGEKRTISIPVAAELIRAVPGSIIRGSSPFGATIFAFTGEIVVQDGGTGTAGDAMTTTKDFLVPAR